MSALTATVAPGSHTIAIHATGCKHAVDVDFVVGLGDTIDSTVARALDVVDPDNDWPGWATKVNPCAKGVLP